MAAKRMQEARRFLAITVDTECDKGPGWRTQRPIRCRNVVEDVPRYFHEPFWHLGVRPTYLLSPEVIQDAEASEVLRGLPGAPELGTHLHGEYVEPEPQWDAEGTYTMQCTYPAELEWAKLRRLTELFRERFGIAPRSFRAGRYGIAARTIPMLAALGYTVDSSVTPYKWWAPEVRFMTAPPFPYYPSPHDISEPGPEGQVLELPVSVLPGIWDKIPAAWRKRFNPYHPVVAWLWRRWNRYVWDMRPRLFYAAFTPLRDLLRTVLWYAQLAERSGHDVVLVMTLHSCELRPGANPYFATRQQCQRFVDTMLRVTDCALRCGFVPATLAEIASQVRAWTG
ncbi:MAG: hypothetical protein ABDH31_02555 [Chlorobiota bacterium]